MKWINAQDQMPSEYEWVILGYLIPEEDEMTWTIGRYTNGDIFEFFSDYTGGVYHRDSFYPFEPDQVTHWIKLESTD